MEPDSKPLVSSMNLEELMEVVTSYRCRFPHCQFACSGRSHMAEHIQNSHAVAPTSDGTSPKVEADPGPVKAVVVEIEGPVDSQAVSATPALLSQLGLSSNPDPQLAANAEPSSHSFIVQPALPDPKVLTNQVRSVAKTLPILAAAQPEMELFAFTTGAGTQTIPVSSLQAVQLTAASGLSLTTNSTTMEAMSLPVADGTKDLGTGPASIAPTDTREMFVCGVCHSKFSLIEECKNHIASAHGASVEAGGVSDTVVDKFDQRVSVGTQATGKRPGRKRKSEMAQTAQASPPRKSKLQEEEEDDDWLPGRSLSSGAREGTQRRKIRTPKALKEDYVIEKKRRYRKRRMSMKESYTLSCSFLGCSSKFRSAESQSVHQDCHNKEDDAFTCCHCQQMFGAWKPLRMHLWRIHTVDCDMFQCDSCLYKTDTVHKLNIHREIHSENRPYTCDNCGKGFKQLSQMKNHQLIHSEHHKAGRQSWFSNKTCPVCKRVFANSKCLKKHVEAVHGQSKPFKCQYCDHTTAWKAMLLQHIRTHTGEKPFKCDICSYSTGDHNSLRRHRMRHTGQRKYKCQFCAYTCIQTISLKTHMRTKHPGASGIFTCQLCKFRTINKQIFHNHLEDHRNGLLPGKKDNDATPQPLGAALELNGTIQLQMQVKKTDSGELHANKDDIDKLNSVPEFVGSGMDANQLIYSALNVGNQTEDGVVYTAQLLNGVQCVVCPSLQPAPGIQSSYSITFFAPATDDQPVEYQLLPDQAGEREEPESQEAEAAVSLTQETSSQSPGNQIFYAQGPTVVDAPAIHDPALQGSSATNVQVLPLTTKTDNLVTTVVTETGKVVNGMEGVFVGGSGESRIVVIESGQVGDNMLIIADHPGMDAIQEAARQAQIPYQQDSEEEEAGPAKETAVTQLQA